MGRWLCLRSRTSSILWLRKQSTITTAALGPVVATAASATSTGSTSTSTVTRIPPHTHAPPPLSSRSSRHNSHPSQKPLQPPPSIPPDPYAFVKSDLAYIRTSLLGLLGSSSPALTQIAEYYFRHPSKQIRPLLVLLFARACNGLGRNWESKRRHAERQGAGGRSDELDLALSRPDVLNDWNPNMPDYTSSFQDVFSLRVPEAAKYRDSSFSPIDDSHSHILPLLSDTVLPTQRRLAQIVEMIHVASLLHDDVLDESPLRRGAPSAPAMFGNKMSVLAGDFLLARASVALSRLGENEVVELISAVIANLVEGEILQIGKGGGDIASEFKNTSTSGDLVSVVLDSMQDKSQNLSTGPQYITPQDWQIYLQKSYFKTASLMAKGVRASVVLGGVQEGEVWKEVAYAYGRNVGIAFQLVDDALDYESISPVLASSDTASKGGLLGKPAGADLKLGLATAPALFAWEEHPDLMAPLIKRRFKGPGDVETAHALVHRSRGIERTRDLARKHAQKAIEALDVLPDSDAKKALCITAERIVERKS
ncbi:hypothetical protein Clacol_007416 [Clathrus columnatus]|uniref:(2E,6E)-farnesyl diphosphate synthase n=1 Tax=Clathrus columnatus TaxID=1419009 RepID=A0AAV5AML2_9AGAM|nr:hypothetical protein Clacol_007416 [Clathrus columnatus]